MTLTRLKKMPTKNGIYYDAKIQRLVEIYRSLVDNSWVFDHYPSNIGGVPFTKDDLKTSRLYGPLVIKG